MHGEPWLSERPIPLATAPLIYLQTHDHAFLLYSGTSFQGNMFCLRVITVLPLLLISTSASFLRLPPQLPSYPTNLTLPIAPNRPPLYELLHTPKTAPKLIFPNPQHRFNQNHQPPRARHKAHRLLHHLSRSAPRARQATRIQLHRCHSARSPRSPAPRRERRDHRSPRLAAPLGEQRRQGTVGDRLVRETDVGDAGSGDAGFAVAC